MLLQTAERLRLGLFLTFDLPSFTTSGVMLVFALEALGQNMMF